MQFVKIVYQVGINKRITKTVCLTRRICSFFFFPKFKEKKNLIVTGTREGYLRAAEYQTHSFFFRFII
jgi:hypothetical protein